MANANNEQHPIDLTLEDDTPPPLPSMRASPSFDEDFFMPSSPVYAATSPSPLPEPRRAPPFGGGNVANPTEVIDLSDEDDEPIQEHVQRPPPIPIRSSSPEIEFLEQRPAQAPLRRPDPPRPPGLVREPWHPPQQPQAGMAAGIFNAVRQTTQNMFNHFPGRLPFIMDMAAHDVAGAEGLEIVEGDGFADINLNYQQAAFDVNQRGSETPAAPNVVYKPPPEPREGFTRSYKEEDVLVCPGCKEELATGGKDEDDPKWQVWVSKSCGHVSVFLANLIKILIVSGLLW